MSAISHSTKFSFGGLFKNLFRRSARNGHASHEAQTETIEVQEEGATAPPIETAPASVHNSNGNGHGASTGVAIPLQAILAALPLELRARVKQTEVGAFAVTVAFDKILGQLSSGVVRVPFRDIRRSAPNVFAPNTDCDGVAVALPLGEILSRLNPSLLVRRPAQKTIEVPAEIASPFTGNSEGLAFSVGNTKPQASAPAAPVLPATTARASTAPPPQVAEANLFQRKPALPSLPAKTTAMPPAGPGKIAMPPQADDAPIFQRKPVAPDAPPISPLTPTQPSVAAPASAEMDAPIFQRKPAIAASSVPPASAPVQPQLRPKDPLAAPPVPRAIQPARPTPAAQANAQSEIIPVPLAKLAEAWPDAVRMEIVQLNLVEARVALPVDPVESALKRGRVLFSWKTLRGWIRPAPLPSVSAHDNLELELPLAVIAPLFVARQKSSGKAQAAKVDETIPNLFFGLPQPEPAHVPTPASKLVDTNYYVWDDTADAAKVDDTDYKRGPGGTDVITKFRTPNEIVARAAALEGVAGAIIALPDGLSVANRIPAELNGDTLAAFLPHIFSKVSMTTKELRMGELNNLNFTVGNVPWKIWRVNAIFFAAFGNAGQPLPTAELAALAAELDRRR